MPIQSARKVGDTVSYRAADHRWENLTVLAITPTAPTGLTATAGAAGTLNDAEYTYRVTAVVDGIESLPSDSDSATTVAGAGAGSVSLEWDAVVNATSYNVYGRTGTIELLDSVDAPTVTFVDDGSLTPDGALPSVAGRANLRVPYGTNITESEPGTEVGEYVYRYSSPGVV